MERLFFTWIAVASFALLAGCGDYSGTAAVPEPPTGSDEGEDHPDDTGGDSSSALESGKALYQAQCQQCHGAEGAGGIGPSLQSSSTCPSCASFDSLWVKIRDTMPSDDSAACDADCAQLVAGYILNDFSTDSGAGGDDEPGGEDGDGSGGSEPGGGDPTDDPVGEDDPRSGGELYGDLCVSCHGDRGQGGVGPSLRGTESCPSCASYESLWHKIRDTMPSGNPADCGADCAQKVARYILDGFSEVTDEDGSAGGGSDDEGACETADTPADPEPEPQPATCSVDFAYQSVWQDGFVAEITIRNFSGAEVDGWRVRFTFPNDQRITNDWNTVLTQDGQAVDARPESYNTRIANNSSVNFGFQGTHGGAADVPTELTLDAPGCIVEAGGGSQTEGGGNAESPLPCGEAPPSPRLLRLLTRWEYGRTVHDLTGLDGDFTANFPTEARVQGYDNNAKIGVVTDRHVDEYLAAAQDIAERAVAERRAALLPCDPASDDNCARTFVERFGLRAFRRPLTTDEREQFLELFDENLSASFDEGMELVIAAMLSSPNFLYRAEVGSQIGDGLYRLGDYELASSLSYLIWGSMPDDTLLDIAATGGLREAEGRLAQAERMFADPRARERLADFASQWLGTSYLFGTFKDPEIFPALTDEVRRAMMEELSRFVNHVAFDSTEGTLDELYRADYVWVNGPLRQYYGLPGSTSDTLFAQQPAGATRGGILALGAVLAAHAHSNESSPIKRGVFVRERLLCQDLPDPPADVDTTPPGLDPSLTTRERFAQHTSDPTCASCHRYIDGTGFGLERYDGAGGYRSSENGQTVDDSGELVDREGLGTATTDAFAGPVQLAQIIAGTESARNCIVKQYYRYAYGYVETHADGNALARLQRQFAEGGYVVRSLITNTIAADEFALRRAGDE